MQTRAVRSSGTVPAPTKGATVPRMTALRRLTPAVLAASALSAAPAAAQDAVPPPTIAITAPAPGATIGAGVATELTAMVPGDFKVISVHLDGGPPLCVFTRPHDAYACPWTPQAADVGPHTVAARVETPDGRVATATSPLVVGRLLPAAVGAHTSRRRVPSGGWRLTTTGAITVPTGLTAAACSGSATVTVVARGRTVIDRSVPVAADCRFASAVTFSAPRAARALQVKVAFGGAQLLAPRSAPVQTLALR